VGVLLRKLAAKVLLLSMPFIGIGCLVLCIDPFNYFRVIDYVPISLKYDTVHSINPVLWDTIDYAHAPTPNIIIGDSRAQEISLDHLKYKTGKQYKHLSANAAKINEIADYFWFATSYAQLESVYIVLNFNMYNFYAFANRVVGAQAALRNPFLYIYNSSVAEASYLVVKASMQSKNARNNGIAMSKDQFWEWALNNLSYQQYGKWKYPTNGHARLQEIAGYCRIHNISLTFLITPHHVDYQKKVLEYNLIDEELRFKRDIAALATTYDYDYMNELTKNKDNFRDPLHVEEVVSNRIIDEIISGNLQYGKLLSATH
jgi:hypothetical protein